MANETEKMTEADLKKQNKGELVHIAEGLGLSIAPDQITMKQLISAILHKQDNPDDNELVFDDADTDDDADAADTDDAADAADSEPAADTNPNHAPPEAEEEVSTGKAKMIKVRSTQREAARDGGWEQRFKERHPDHPDGYAWVANGKVHKVAETAAVKQAILDGRIEKV